MYLGDNTFIPVSTEAMNLGVTLDSNLSFSSHISMVVGQAYKMISNIGKIKKYLEVSDLKCLVQCF